MDVKDASSIKGFLIPEFVETLPDGRKLNGLTSEGFSMVMAGYACGECMAIFDRFRLSCPVCKTMLNPSEVRPAPQLWLDHLEERYADEPYERPKSVGPTAAIAEAMQRPDVEIIPAAKTRPSKHGRGRPK